MARIRRYGYIVEWFKGDHEPRHVHVFDAQRRFIGRLDVNRMQGIEGWSPDKKLVKLMGELRTEGLL